MMFSHHLFFRLLLKIGVYVNLLTLLISSNSQIEAKLRES